MVEPIITYSERKELQQSLKLLCKNNGINNQIIHLQCPDDNEDIHWVFDYLEREIDFVMLKWFDLKEKILSYKRRLI